MACQEAWEYPRQPGALGSPQASHVLSYPWIRFHGARPAGAATEC